MRQATADIAFGLAMAGGSGALWLHTRAAGYRMGEQIAYDAGLVPGVFLAVAFLSALVMAIRGLLASRGGNDEPAPAMALPRLALAAGSVTVFVAAFLFAGFWPAMVLLVPAMSVVFGYRRPLTVGLVTLGFAAFLWAVFDMILKVPLPAGPWS